MLESLCGRLVAKGVLFCCGPCGQASDGKYEIHESGPLAHTESCNKRWETRLGMKHYGFFCWLRRHRRGAADMKAYAIAGVVIDFCNTCSREHLADIDYEALRAR